MTLTETAYYNEMVKHGIATPEELKLAWQSTGGSFLNVLKRELFFRTGYHDINKFWENEVYDKG